MSTVKTLFFYSSINSLRCKAVIRHAILINNATSAQGILGELLPHGRQVQPEG